ncbi:hypothetical protein AtubIFM57258_003300 [Aspergillus tubingensis]|nr:hypothetical protein AtubIFM57258_003300 [Aspergillus tubingensis]
MSDIGKRDVLGHAILPMSSFDQARSFYTTDSLQVMQSNLDQGKGATSATEIVEPYADFLNREVVHASRITCFDAADAASAFRYMQSGKHIGKIVIRMPEDPAGLPTATSLATPEFSALEKFGGVIQLALALKDSELHDMSYEDWQCPLAPKVHGTWNLHQALSSTPLDFFIMVGSNAGIHGSPSQANYAAANTFFVGLAKYRHSLGPTAEIGYVSRQSKLQRYFDSLGVRYVHEQDLLNVVHLLIKHSEDPALLQNSALLDYPNMDSTTKTKGETADEELTNFISKIHASPAMLDQPEAVEFIIRKIDTSLMPMDLKRSGVPDLTKLALFPIDSLVAIELRAWARNRLNVEVEHIEISSVETVKGFSQLIIDLVREKLRVLAE